MKTNVKFTLRDGGEIEAVYTTDVPYIAAPKAIFDFVKAINADFKNATIEDVVAIEIKKQL